MNNIEDLIKKARAKAAETMHSWVGKGYARSGGSETKGSIGELLSELADALGAASPKSLADAPEMSPNAPPQRTAVLRDLAACTHDIAVVEQCASREHAIVVQVCTNCGARRWLPGVGWLRPTIVEERLKTALTNALAESGE